MPFQIVRNDLVNVKADALVLPSNERLIIDGGTGLAVGKRAGLWRLRRACKRIGGCPTGSAVATPAFGLDAKNLIHAVGPVWGRGGEEENARLLRSAYDASLSLAAELGCASVALPLLSAGTFGCPPQVSLDIALDAIEAHLLEHETKVTLVLYSRSAFKAGLEQFEQIESYIDDNYAASYSSLRSEAYGRMAEQPLPAASSAAPRWPRPAPKHARRESVEEATDYWLSEEESYSAETFHAPVQGAGAEALGRLADGRVPAAPSADFGAAPANLDDMLGSLDAGFTETLLALIDESGRTDADVYKSANITRQHFSKIRKDPHYRPTKRTAVALAVALELDLPATQDLLARAGYTLTHASKFDVIVEYFIVNGIYNTYRINEALYAYDQQLLG